MQVIDILGAIHKHGKNTSQNWKQQTKMQRGTILFKCTECGTPDIEYAASTLSVPQRCPECHSFRTRPSRLSSITSCDAVYEKIWQEIDENSEG